MFCTYQYVLSLTIILSTCLFTCLFPFYVSPSSALPVVGFSFPLHFSFCLNPILSTFQYPSFLPYFSYNLSTLFFYILLSPPLSLSISLSLPSPYLSLTSLLCARHVVVTVGPILTPCQWEVVCLGFHRACSLSLFSLHQLMAAFKPGSHNFYGDSAHVKVAARRDSSTQESLRLRQLAQQVKRFKLKFKHILGCNMQTLNILTSNLFEKSLRHLL